MIQPQPTRVLIPLFFGLLMLVLSGCQRTQEIPCDGNENCPGDMACLSGTCQARACIASSQCPIGSFCDQNTGQCQTGCMNDTDCEYGLECSGGSCVTRACRSTELDCEFGEYCDADLGTCYAAAGTYCKPCASAADCGGGNSRCVYVSGEGPWCAPECSTTVPCPAGYSCVPFSSSGTIIGYNCVTLCQNIYGTPTGTNASIPASAPAGTRLELKDASSPAIAPGQGAHQPSARGGGR